MSDPKRIPLDERLKMTAPDSPVILSAFELFLSDYCNSISRMTGNDALARFHNAHLKQLREKDGMEPMLCDIVYLRQSLTPEKRMEFFYRILVQPFARLMMKEYRQEDSLPL